MKQFSTDTDHDWEQWGRQDPYFGVITDPRFRRNSLTDQALDDFFESGRSHALHIIHQLRAHIDPAFTPKSMLDFGCGVGRVLLPASFFVEEVLGIDVSNSMLEQARHHAERMGVKNCELRHQGDLGGLENRRFDFVHSTIVLQHLDVQRGLHLIGELVDLLDVGGCAALQLTYSKAAYAAQLGMPPPPPPTAPAGTKTTKPSLRAAVPARESAVAEPPMLMNPYPLNAVFWQLQSRGITELHTQFTDHGGELGVFLFFQRRQAAGGNV
jgi:2-polyprenyl-3-methyl-5-hydroxy-6-metoxy-1,4-benzoquinol methylase